MWTRKELKEKAKIRFKANYWKAVLAGLILTIVMSGSNCGGANSSSVKYNNNNNKVTEEKKENSDSSFDFNFEIDNDEGENEVFNFETPDNNNSDEEMSVAMVIGIIVGVMVVVIVVMAIVFAIAIFFICPVAVGCKHFFSENVKEKASLKTLLRGFNTNYLNVVKIAFFENLYVTLWTMLFIIPGVIKSYEYRMIPYIVGDNPDIDVKEAFALSKKMMDGNKWNTFVLDLSFIGWSLLSLLTVGIVGVFYVNPYIYQTDAVLYARLSGKDVEIEDEPMQEECYIEVE